MIQSLKCFYHLPAASSIVFVDPDSNEPVYTSKTADFWTCSAYKVSKYDLVVDGPLRKKIIFLNIIKYFMEIYLNKRFNVKYSIEINLNIISFLIDTHHGIGGENKPKKKK
jgi:hypothetical protein